MVSAFRRRVLAAVALGVALPSLVLAALGVMLTLRIERSLLNDAVRYNSYLAQLVGESFENELQAHLQQEIQGAESTARAGLPVEDVRRALADAGPEFLGSHFVPFEDIGDYATWPIQGSVVFYAEGAGRHRAHEFYGLLLRDARGDLLGVGGWYVDRVAFLRDHFEHVLQDRLPANPRMYGGIELTRRTSIELLGPGNERVARVREPGDQRTARTEAMVGPFEGFSVKVAVTPDAPPAWTGRFLAFELVFIVGMAGVIVAAVWFGYRYTIRQLELAQMKAGFIGNVTHELKTPIAMVRLAVETLQMRRVQSPEDSAKFLGIIERETSRLTRLVESILDFARLEAGQATFRFEKVEVEPLVREAVETLKPRLDQLGFAVRVDVAPGLPRVRADAQAVSHCLLNLLDNAIKYSKDRREIAVSASPRDGGVALAVADRGIGIAPADRKRIFEKFVRIENGLVHDVRGAGLGLSLVDQIIRAHRGRVEVSSTPGEGSTFTLVLPSAEGVLAEAEAARDRSQHAGGAHGGAAAG